MQSIKDYIGSFFQDDEEPAVKTEEPDYELPKTSVPYGIRRAEEGRFKDMIFQGPGEFEKRFKQKGVYDYKNPFDPTFYVVLSMFRTIAILEGVYSRYINGNESSPNAKDIGRDVLPLAKATFNLI